MPNLNELRINGKSVPIEAEAERTLLSVLRDDLDMTGTKYGCGESQCGACTVLVDGAATRSCTTTLDEVVGKEITTIEGLAREDGALHPVQAAFLEHGSMQCAYCTSGMIMSAVALLQRTPDPSTDDIVRFMDGNICRCGTYPRVIKAIETAAQATKEAGR